MLGVDRTPGAMAAAGFHVCRTDLEDELIRAVGPDGVIGQMDEHGDLGAFRTLQKQPQWVDRPVEAQMRRFIGSGARRKLRYASILTKAAAAADSIPAPLLAVTSCVRRPRG